MTDVATLLSDRFPDLTRGIRGVLSEAISELIRDGRLLELLGDAIEGNVATILHMLRHSIPLEDVEVPTAAVAHARRLAQHGVPVTALVRAYRLGQGHLLEECHIALTDSASPNPEIGLRALSILTSRTFAYIDWVSQEVVTAYEAERDQWVRQQDAARLAQIRDMVAGRDRSGHVAAEKVLQYRLHQQHLATILWAREDAIDPGPERLDETITVLTRTLGAGTSPLMCAADRTTRWLWFGRGADPTEPDVRTVEAALRSAGIERTRVALGGVGTGVEGFRRSHLQAAKARLVLHRGDDGARDVIGYRESGVATASLLARDLDEARFLVHSVLGPLAADDAGSERLRETLLAFLECGSSYTVTARRQSLHKNSVKYRVERALEQRGRTLDQDRIDVELALVACRWLGDIARRHDPDFETASGPPCP